MLKVHISWLLSAALLLATMSQPVAAQGDKAQTVETVKAKLAKLGLGEKAKATIRLKDGSKVKGYVARADEDDFVMRDRKTDAPTTIRYADVAKVESNRGHSTARNIGLGVGIGVGAFLLALAISFAHLD
jgi:hypothetical protein